MDRYNDGVNNNDIYSGESAGNNIGNVNEGQEKGEQMNQQEQGGQHSTQYEQRDNGYQGNSVSGWNSRISLGWKKALPM